MAIASYLAGLDDSPDQLVLKTGSYFRPDPKSGFRKRFAFRETHGRIRRILNPFEIKLIRNNAKKFASSVTDTRDREYSERITYVLRVNNALGSLD